MIENNSNSDSDRIENECNRKAQKIEYFILHGSWDNSWVTTCFGNMCGRTFPVRKSNVYKLKVSSSVIALALKHWKNDMLKKVLFWMRNCIGKVFRAQALE